MRPLLPRRGSRSVGLCALIAPLFTLGACAKDADARATYLDLDCGQPFVAQAARITAQTGLDAAPEDPAEPYRFFSSPDLRTAYLITKPAAPGHPAIMMQKAKGSDVITTGCPYGDRSDFDRLLAYLDSLKDWKRQ